MGWISLPVIGGTAFFLGGLLWVLWRLARMESGSPALAWFGQYAEEIPNQTLLKE